MYNNDTSQIIFNKFILNISDTLKVGRKHRLKRKSRPKRESKATYNISSDLDNANDASRTRVMTRDGCKSPKKYVDRLSSSSLDSIASDSEVSQKTKTILKRQAKMIYRQLRELRAQSQSEEESSLEKTTCSSRNSESELFETQTMLNPTIGYDAHEMKSTPDQIIAPGKLYTSKFQKF